MIDPEVLNLISPWAARVVCSGSARSLARFIKHMLAHAAFTDSSAIRLAEAREELSLVLFQRNRFRGGEVPALPTWPEGASSVWEEADNPHWPNLTSHGVYVAVGHHHGQKRPYVEVQILPPDAARSQHCTFRVFKTQALAIAYAEKMLAVGREVVAATKKLNARASAPSAEQGQLTLL